MSALRAYFSGQNIALGAIAVPLFTVICFGLAAVAKHPIDGFLALAVGLAGIGAGLALANLFTVTSAYPVEKRGGTPTPRAASAHGGEPFGSWILTVLGVGVAVTPVILAAVFTRTHPAAIWMPVLVLSVAEQKLPELAQIAIQSAL
jgi:ABC-2 type transport system permease protein